MTLFQQSLALIIAIMISILFYIMYIHARQVLQCPSMSNFSYKKISKRIHHFTSNKCTCNNIHLTKQSYFHVLYFNMMTKMSVMSVFVY